MCTRISDNYVLPTGVWNILDKIGKFRVLFVHIVAYSRLLTAVVHLSMFFILREHPRFPKGVKLQLKTLISTVYV